MIIEHPHKNPKNGSQAQLGISEDRGQQGLDVLVLLLSLKLRHSSRLHLLRGRHECGSISRIYGFYDECKKRSDVKAPFFFVLLRFFGEISEF